MWKRVIQFLESFTEFLKHSQKTMLLMVIVVLAILLLHNLVLTWLQETDNLSIPSFATIETFGVKAYWDSDLRTEITDLSWPTVYPGTSNNVTLYLHSVSNIKATLELQTTNWTFRNSNDTIVSGPASSTKYMILTWNYNNVVVDPNQTVRVTLTLSIDNSANFISFLINNNVKQFSFDIIIRVSEPR